MKIDELKAKCNEALANPLQSAGGFIPLVGPTRGGLFPKGGGPRGKCVGSQRGTDGKEQFILMYKAADILAALKKSEERNA